jgi:hypothetical protein
MGSTGGCSTSCGGSGTRTCSGSCTWSGCNAAETCNGADDDCDGVTDDGFRAVVQNTTYSSMYLRWGMCDGGTQLIGPECNATIHRFCWTATPSCATSGFGPVESAGDSVSVTCVIAPPAIDATFPALQAIHSGCDGFVQHAGPDCNAAINRYCRDRGYVSGFGPVENSYPTAWVVCVSSATAVYVNATYTTLSAYQWMCTGSYERWGLYCNSAIHNYCRALGHASGFGPVENSGDNADVICVDS